MKQLYAFFKKWEIFIISSIIIITAILSYIAFRCEDLTRSESLYKSLQLFTLKTTESKNHCALFEVAKWLAAFIFVYASIKLVLVFVRDRLEELAIRFYKDHIIICGLSWKVKGIIKEMKLGHKKIVIIEKNKKHEDISDYTFCKNVKILIGDAEDDEVLKKVNLCNASYVFAFSENDQSNLRIVDSIQNIYDNRSNKKSISKRKEPLKIRIHLREYFNLMVFKEFHKNSDGKIDYHAFNVYQQAAQKVVDEFSPDQFLSIKNENAAKVHILVSGLTMQGEYIILEAAQMYHFANLKKLQISIVDSDIKRKISGFISRFPSLEDIVDIEAIDTNDFFKMANNKLKLADVSVCFICHDDDAESISSFINYRQFFYGIIKTIEKPEIVTILPQNTSIKGLFPNLDDNAKILIINIRELYNDFCKKSVLVDNKEEYDNIAKYIDFIYESDQEKINSNINKYSKENWDKKTDFEKDWNRYPARHFDIKLRTAGIQLTEFSNEKKETFKLINLNDETKKLLAQMEHRRWCAEKLLTGFVVGEPNDDKQFEKFLKRKLKYHPEIVEWTDLPPEEKIKDYYTIDSTIYVARRALQKL